MKRILYYFKRNNMSKHIKINIIFTSLIPVFIIALAAYIYLANNEWNGVKTDSQTALSQSATYINIDIEAYLQSSAQLAGNTNLLRELEQTTEDSTEKKMELYMFFDAILKNYRDPFESFEQLIIYTDNDSVLESSCMRRIGSLPDELKNEVFNLDYGKVLWVNNENSIAFFRKMGSRHILKVNFPFYKIGFYLKNKSAKSVISSYNKMYYYNTDETQLPENRYVVQSVPVKNGQMIYHMIPKRLKYQIYIKYFLIIFITYLLFSVILVFTATYISNAITKRLNSFITDIKNNNFLTRDIAIDELDEFVVIKQKIKELIDAVNTAHLQVIEEKNAKQAIELELLQTKINPHLLYNSLSILKWNAIGSNNKKAVHIIDTLSSYYRSVLSKGQYIITVQQEIELIKQYICIMQFTYSHTYELEVDIPESILSARTIKLVFQPIVENSILHGLNKKPDSKIVISGHWENDKIIIQISDNGLGISPENVEKINRDSYVSQYKSYGLKNTRHRIQLYYGDGCGLYITSREGEGTTVTFTLRDLDACPKTGD